VFRIGGGLMFCALLLTVILLVRWERKRA